MSGQDHGTYRSGAAGRSSAYTSEDERTRNAALKARSAGLHEAKIKAEREMPRERAKSMAPAIQPVDASLARNVIGTPPASVKEVHIVLVDNSGSNRQIAQSLKNAAGYLHGTCGSIAGNAAIAMIFFSDHGDGRGLEQQVDYTEPTAEGEKILRASIDQVRDASGDDAPEAIECTLHQASQLDFGHVPQSRRFLYLVTDVVAHGMGMSGDEGCPHKRDWKESLSYVRQSFARFQVIASGSDSHTFELQKQFIVPARQRYDLLDLATGGLSAEERNRLVTNALLFFIARNRGMQTVEGFLMALLEKWMAEPMYGSRTLAKAKVQIGVFVEYLEASVEDKRALMDRIFTGTE